ncbi:MAG: SDR family oxidoreductase [Staphylococcus simulans]|uniref:SDR family oxidoreductase n=1 Tax=Staphylococcus TaxID=1279 RepID=UPI0008AA4410|nr:MULTISPECIES: SDR family oxidoreductase [Staphylococcus]MDK7925903.1 SDR family oxidoreductase [Staphylococcus simulans]MDK8315775.1 SDR family oxidoreductase [Staphylococcus simulans]OHR47456.1 oxidoreductase [Staphylococcus sp. HMSC056D08]OHS44812.1 oxidoreductase [Staphylococcus sp. HMSC65H10]
MTELNKKVAVITGASSGIGKGIALKLSNEGATVVLVARDEKKLDQVSTELRKAGAKNYEIISADVTNREDIDCAVQQAVEEFGKVDILVNSAGQMKSSAITEGEVQAWDDMIDVNLKGTLYAINAVMPHFQQQQSGHIVNIASISGFEVTKSSALYSATKAAVHAITQGLEKELAKTGIRSTSISPGMVDTAMTSDTDWGSRKMLEPKDIANAVVYALTQPSHVNVNEITVRPV